jgi:hypothetical protein
MVGGTWARTVRLLIMLVAGVCVLATVAAAMLSAEREFAEAFDRSPDYGATIVFTVVMTALTVGAFALYVWKISGPASSIVVGLLMLVPTAWVFVYSASETVAGRAGGAGGPFLWLAVPVVVLNYVVAAVGILVDRIGRRAP